MAKPDPALKLREDRAMRDAARGLVQADLGFIRESVATRSVPARLADRVTGGARDIADEAVVAAVDNRNVLGAGLAVGVLAAAGWLLRAPLLAGAKRLLARTGIGAETAEPKPPADRSLPE